MDEESETALKRIWPHCGKRTYKKRKVEEAKEIFGASCATICNHFLAVKGELLSRDVKNWGDFFLLKDHHLGIPALWPFDFLDGVFNPEKNKRK